MPQKSKTNTHSDSPANTLNDISANQSPAKTKPKKPISRRKKIILIVLAVSLILFLAGVLIWYFLIRTSTQPQRPSTSSQVKEEKPVLVPSPLTGVGVSEAEAKQPVVAAIIENLYPDARPQSGLADAGIVYEALAEGGITRYQAFYQKIPAEIGPIRSLRTYFVLWALEYIAPVLHAGGNINALDLARTTKMLDLDQFANGRYFTRINSRQSPHNLYIKADKLKELMIAKNFTKPPEFTPWPRKDDNKSNAPNATTITVDYSQYNYQAKFSYDPNNNDYTRYLRGAADVDANTKAPIKPKSIVVLQVQTSNGTTRIGEQAVSMSLVGTGKAYVFQDGTVTIGQWKKSTQNARTQITDSNGQPIKLNKGQTWVSVLPTNKTVTYQ